MALLREEEHQFVVFCKVYQVLSRRLKDKFDIFGGLPDTIEDNWIESVEKREART